VKKVLIGLILFLASTTCWASELGQPVLLDVYLLNSEARFIRGVSQEFVSRSSTNNFAVGGRYGATTLLLEYALFTETSGNATLSIANARREYIVWWKEHLYSFGFGDLYSALGLGGYKEEVRTTLNGTSLTDQGETSAMAGIGLGVSSLIFKHIIVSLEGRIVAGSNFDPNPSPGILFRSGFEF
jgi:hypothetical protein